LTYVLEKVRRWLGFSSQRRHERKRSEDHLLVSLDTGKNGAKPVLGQVLDINELGLSFRYPGVKCETEGAAFIDILVHGNSSFNVHGLPCRVVYDETLERKGLLPVPPLRRCGVEFKSLSQEQKERLSRLIRAHAA